MIVNCKRARLYIALSVGGDLDDDDEWELSSHTETCDACRRYHRRMRSEFPATDLNETASGFATHDSVWPELAEKLPARPGRRAPEFNGWWAALAVSVACAMLGALLQNESERPRSPAPVASVANEGAGDTEAAIPRPTPSVGTEQLPEPRIPGIGDRRDSGHRFGPMFSRQEAVASFLVY